MSTTEQELTALEAQVGSLRNECEMKEEATLSLVAAWLNARGQTGLAKRLHPHIGDELRRVRDKGSTYSFNYGLDRKTD